MKCPWSECGYVRKENETCPEWQCPSCYNAYNKHPDYLGNNYYKIKLVVGDIPSDDKIEPGVLLLYLKNGSVEGCFIEHSVINRIPLSNKELPNILDIINKLKNPGGKLTDEEERAIFLLTARFKNYPLVNENDKTENYFKKIIYVLLGVLILIILYIILRGPFQAQTFLPTTNTQLMNQNKAEVPYLGGVNLQDISNTITEAENLLNQCIDECDDRCVELRKYMQSTSAKILNFTRSVRPTTISRLNSATKRLILNFNDRILKIKEKINSIKDFCKNQKKTSINSTVDFVSAGINLDIVYSKIFYADIHLRNCRLSCETNDKFSSECQEFIQLRKDFTSDINRINDVMQGKTVSSQDEQTLKKINVLVDDINSEKEKIQRCLDKTISD
ncbi:hypothetical protein [Legionella sp. PC997]|uniref:hypothetical protein n=1 Tax=Legionella sp. PC997 TaxID=2755562 RepID=UPI0015F807B9|nr:hypothetical protein [Legionella sp. PC997]QMT62140.1 hypothetical protein HBNCFIEN_03548 [Legionella sp. PC997]